MPTTSEIRKMTTKQLQGLYEKIHGKPTSNRNKGLLMQRLLKSCEARRPAKAKSKPTPKSTRASRQRLTPADIGIGKTLEHGMRVGKYAGKVATCGVVKDGFAVHCDGDDLGVHPTLGAAAQALGQQANGQMFWGIKPYPRHAAKE